MGDGFDEDAVDDWSMRTHGEAPVEMTHWSTIDDHHEVMLRYPRKVVLVRLKSEPDSNYSSVRHIVIRVEEWNPGAVQANRLSDGSIKVRFRRQSMTLSAMMKTPHAISSHLEEWLMGMRTEPLRSDDEVKRVQTVRRNRDAITRMLDQASVEKLVEAVESIGEKVDEAEAAMAGRAAQDSGTEA